MKLISYILLATMCLSLTGCVIRATTYDPQPEYVWVDGYYYWHGGVKYYYPGRYYRREYYYRHHR